MESRAERVKKFSEMYSKSRTDAGYSQDYMALELGVTRKTIASWEKGESSPSFFQSSEWFRALGLNPMPYYLDYLYQSQYRSLNKSEADEKIESTLNEYISKLTIKQKRALLYILYGSYNGNINSTLQLFLAYTHLPIFSRYSIAKNICDIYDMCDELNTLHETDHILPNIKSIRKSIEDARVAILKHKKGY